MELLLVTWTATFFGSPLATTVGKQNSWGSSYCTSPRNSASRRFVACESLAPFPSKISQAAVSFLVFLSSITDSIESAQKFLLTCLRGFSATVNLFPSRLLSGKPAQTGRKPCLGNYRGNKNMLEHCPSTRAWRINILYILMVRWGCKILIIST